jgi:predicted histone-like DNA-binding protein
VKSVIENLKVVIQKRLDAGYSVRLDKFGSFRVSVSSTSAPTPEELSSRNVKQTKLIFTPAPKLKDSLNKIRVEITG